MTRTAAAALDDPVLKRFRAALDAIYGERIERVVLFGSRARGDGRRRVSRAAPPRRSSL